MVVDLVFRFEPEPWLGSLESGIPKNYSKMVDRQAKTSK